MLSMLIPLSCRNFFTTDSCINKHGIIILSKVIAVSAASAAERNEFQHLYIILRAKVRLSYEKCKKRVKKNINES